MTKILMLNNEFPPLGGGTASVNLAILKELADIDNLSIDLITSSEGKRDEYQQFSKNIRIFKVPVNSKNIHHASNLELIKYFSKATITALSLSRKNQYVACLAWCTVPAGAVALLMQHLRGIPYIIRVSGPDLPGFEKRYQCTVRILLPLLKVIWRKARIIIAKCEEEKNTLLSACPNLQVKIIPNGVDTKLFHPKSPPRTLKQPFTFLSVGRLVARKNQDLIIHALHKLIEEGIEARLVLVGDGDAKKDYQNLIKDLNLQDVVDLRGYVDREQLPLVYQEADCFILASDNEGMSVALLEAIASGLPVITTDTGGALNIIGEEQRDLLLEKPDVATLSSKMAQMVHKSGSLEELSKTLKERALQYSWSIPAKEMAALFKAMDTNS